MNVIVISLGGLHCGTLGCYGGESVETSAIDRFAVEAFVFDQCLVESPCPKTTRNNWWTGCLQYFQHYDTQRPADGQPSLIAALRSHGVRTVLIRDTSLLISRAELDAMGFEHVHEIERNDYDTTGKVFDTATRWLEQHSRGRPFLLFLDCHGVHPPWPATAPTEQDSRAADPAHDDIAGSEEQDAEFARDMCEDDDTGQQLEQYLETDPYLLAVSQLDEQAGQLLNHLRGGRDGPDTLVAITSDAGRSADRSVPAAGQQFDLSELRIHVPLILRYPGIEPAQRSSAIVQSIDLMPTVLDALGVAIPGPIDGRSLLPICRMEQSGVRDIARLACPGGERAVRTANWYLVQTQSNALDSEATEPRLFAKPDDRWERDDVAKQYAEVIAELNRFW